MTVTKAGQKLCDELLYKCGASINERSELLAETCSKIHTLARKRRRLAEALCNFPDVGDKNRAELDRADGLLKKFELWFPVETFTTGGHVELQDDPRGTMTRLAYIDSSGVPRTIHVC